MNNAKFKKNVASNKDFVFWMSTDDFANTADVKNAMSSAEKFGIPAPVNKKSPYSIDLNLLGRSVELVALLLY